MATVPSTEEMEKIILEAIRHFEERHLWTLSNKLWSVHKALASASPLLGTQPVHLLSPLPPSSGAATPQVFSSFKALEDTLLQVRQTLRNSSGSCNLNLHEDKGQLNFSLEGTMPPPESADAKTQRLYEENLRARNK